MTLLSTHPVHRPLCAKVQLTFYISLYHVYLIQGSIYNTTPKEMEMLQS